MAQMAHILVVQILLAGRVQSTPVIEVQGTCMFLRYNRVFVIKG